MARTADQIQAEIDKLQANLSRGILRFRYGEQETFYQSADEMRQTIAALRAELAAVQNASVGRIYFQTSKGI